MGSFWGLKHGFATVGCVLPMENHKNDPQKFQDVPPTGCVLNVYTWKVQKNDGKWQFYPHNFRSAGQFCPSIFKIGCKLWDFTFNRKWYIFNVLVTMIFHFCVHFPFKIFEFIFCCYRMRLDLTAPSEWCVYWRNRKEMLGYKLAGHPGNIFFTYFVEKESNMSEHKIGFSCKLDKKNFNSYEITILKPGSPF